MNRSVGEKCSSSLESEAILAAHRLAGRGQHSQDRLNITVARYEIEMNISVGEKCSRSLQIVAILVAHRLAARGQHSQDRLNIIVARSHNWLSANFWKKIRPNGKKSTFIQNYALTAINKKINITMAYLKTISAMSNLANLNPH
jgi:hypothetical protein